MPTIKNNLNRQGTVLVEHSDERLAAVEEAKRTGQEFQSVGSKGSEIVDRDALVEATRKVSNEKYGQAGSNLPDYLRELKEGVEDEAELNQRKAAEHSDMSNEIVRVQQEMAVSDAEKLRQDPKYFVKKIAQLNNKLAANYAETVNKYAEQRASDRNGVEREVVKLRAESIHDPNPATSLGKLAKTQVTDINEDAASEALQQKDRIIYGEDSYKAQARKPRQIGNEAQPRAEKTDLTAEPNRVEEPTRKQKAKFPRNERAEDQANEKNDSEEKNDKE